MPVDVTVSSVVTANHVFVQQPTHPSFFLLQRQNDMMSVGYNQDQSVPELPRPIERKAAILYLPIIVIVVLYSSLPTNPCYSYCKVVTDLTVVVSPLFGIYIFSNNKCVVTKLVKPNNTIKSVGSLNRLY